MHCGEKLLNLLKQNNIVPLFVTAAYMDKPQPLGLSINRAYKEELKAHIHNWFSAQVIKLINQQEDNSGQTVSVVVDLKTLVLKPIHANWVISTHSKM